MIEIITHLIIRFYQHLAYKIYVRKKITILTILTVAFHFYCSIMHEAIQVVYLGRGDVCQLLECDLQIISHFPDVSSNIPP